MPITKNLNDNQRDALISFAYNCGAGSLRTLCKGRTAAQIAEAILLYNKAGGKVLAGLTKRRKAERELFLRAVDEAASSAPITQTSQEGEEYKMDTIKKGSKGKAVKIWQIIIGVSTAARCICRWDSWKTVVEDWLGICINNRRWRKHGRFCLVRKEGNNR